MVETAKKLVTTAHAAGGGANQGVSDAKGKSVQTVPVTVRVTVPPLWY